MPDEQPQKITPAGNGVRTLAAPSAGGVGIVALLSEFGVELSPMMATLVGTATAALFSAGAQWARAKAPTLPEGSFGRILLKSFAGNAGG